MKLLFSPTGPLSKRQSERTFDRPCSTKSPQRVVRITDLLVVCLAVGGLLGGPVWADGPLLPPEAKAVCSQNGFFCAVMDPEQKVTTVVRRRAGGVSQPLWSMDGWFRVAFVSNDGEYLVTGYDGGNLLPLKYKKDQVMISFYDRGRLIGQVRLNEMISDFSK